MEKGSNNRRRDIPAARVAAFIEHYISTNYELDESEPTGTYQFAFETGLPARTIFRIRNLESTNVRFELLDDMLIALDRNYLWTWEPEKGGFADYYGDEPAAPAAPTIEQQRKNAVAMAKRYARRNGSHWLEVLRERAETEMELACA